MPLPPEYLQQLQDRRDEEDRLATAESRRAFVATIFWVLFSVAAGMTLIAFSLRTSDESLGRIWWWLGWLVWVAGVWVTLMRAYHRGIQRGDWT